VDCNEAACQTNGYTRAELIGKSIDILNEAPGTADERLAYFEQLKPTGSITLETYHRHKDGTLFPVEVSTSLIPVGGRELILGLDRDITQRRQVQAELTREKQYFESLVLNSPAAIVVLDQGRICERGTHDKLMSAGGIYQKLYELQFLAAGPA